MAKPVLLNNVDHQNLRVITQRGTRHGDGVMFAMTFPSEFRDLQAHYPIIFRKTEDGVTFEPIALFGFQEGENLFATEDDWDASYVPLAVTRQPFLIGVGNGELMVHIDMDSPRVSQVEGEAVFRDHGGTTEFLEKMNSTLLTIHEGLLATAPFMQALNQHELLESFVLDVELDDGSQGRLAGFYTINEDRLASLGADAVASLHQNGYLQAIYMAVASLSQFRALIERKNHAARR